MIVVYQHQTRPKGKKTVYYIMFMSDNDGIMSQLPMNNIWHISSKVAQKETARLTWTISSLTENMESWKDILCIVLW